MTMPFRHKITLATVLFIALQTTSFGQDKHVGEKESNKTINLKEVPFKKILICKLEDAKILFDSFEYEKYLESKSEKYMFSNEIKDAIKRLSDYKNIDSLDVSSIISEKVLNITYGFLADQIEAKKVVVVSLKSGAVQKTIVRQKFSVYNNSRNSHVGRRYYINGSKKEFLKVLDMVS